MKRGLYSLPDHFNYNSTSLSSSKEINLLNMQTLLALENMCESNKIVLYTKVFNSFYVF